MTAALARLGDFAAAARTAGQALEAAEESGSIIERADVNMLVGSAFLEMGRLEPGLELVQRGTDLVLYALVMGFAFVTVSTWVRFREQELRYSRLARTIALANAVRPEDQIDVRIMKPVRDDDPLQA